jgi:hypothetical protein
MNEPIRPIKASVPDIHAAPEQTPLSVLTLPPPKLTPNGDSKGVTTTPAKTATDWDPTDRLLRAAGWVGIPVRIMRHTYQLAAKGELGGTVKRNATAVKKAAAAPFNAIASTEGRGGASNALKDKSNRAVVRVKLFQPSDVKKEVADLADRTSKAANNAFLNGRMTRLGVALMTSAIPAAACPPLAIVLLVIGSTLALTGSVGLSKALATEESNLPDDVNEKLRPVKEMLDAGGKRAAAGVAFLIAENVVLPAVSGLITGFVGMELSQALGSDAPTLGMSKETAVAADLAFDPDTYGLDEKRFFSILGINTTPDTNMSRGFAHELGFHRP